VKFGPDTFVVRFCDEGMQPAFQRGDFLYVDPDVPAEDGRYVAIKRETGTTVRLYREDDGRRELRTLNPDRVDCVVDASNETMISGVVVFAGRTP